LRDLEEVGWDRSGDKVQFVYRLQLKTKTL
jgi:hypothetical protein